MKANELRIGNIVDIQFAGTPVYWAWSFIKVDDIRGITDYPDLYKPIPLTEEWLIKFGFEKWCNIYTISIPNEHALIQIECIVSEKEFNLYLITESDHTSVSHCVEEKANVHQLQNLYYALTQEELAI